MDIHIDVGRIDFKVNEIRNLFACGNQLFVSIHHCLMEIRMTHIAPVHKEILMGTFLTGCFGFGYITRNFHHCSVDFYTEQLLVKFLAKNRKNTLPQMTSGKIEQFGVIAIQ